MPVKIRRCISNFLALDGKNEALCEPLISDIKRANVDFSQEHFDIIFICEFCHHDDVVYSEMEPVVSEILESMYFGFRNIHE
jgi:hypothetical protein